MARHDVGVTASENPHLTYTEIGAGDLASITVRQLPAAIVVAVSGEIDLSTAPLLEHAVRESLAQSPAALVVDLSEATFFSSAGMAVLLLAHRGSAEGKFRIVARDRVILHPLELTGLTEELSVHPTLESALESASESALRQ